MLRRSQPSFFAWHPAPEWSTTIPSLNTKACAMQKILSGQTTEILNVHGDLDLEHSNSVFSLDTLAYDNLLYLLAKDSLVQMIQTVIIFITIISPHCNLDLEDRTPPFFFCRTLQSMMMHHHTKFGYKSFSGSQDILWTKPNMSDRQADGHGNFSVTAPPPQ